MKAPSSVMLIFLLLLTGCTSLQQTTAPVPQRELILLTPLPPLTGYATAFGAKLSAVFHVLPDGTVKDVSLERSSGDTEWDPLAVDSLRHWRFAPLRGNEKPVDRFIRYAIVVQVQEPVVMHLAELVVPAKRKADSLHSLLMQGTDFESLARSALTEEGAGSWRPAEPTNLARYPNHVRAAVSRLHVDEVTEPIRLGLNYVIIKRYQAPE